MIRTQLYMLMMTVCAALQQFASLVDEPLHVFSEKPWSAELLIETMLCKSCKISMRKPWQAALV